MNEPTVLSLDDADDPQLVGGKAAALCRLLQRHHPVPPGICVTRLAYDHALAEAGLQPETLWRMVRGASPADRLKIGEMVRGRLERVAFPESVLRAVHAGLQSFAMRYADTSVGSVRTWVVRSSATHEDGSTASCAGLYATRLGVELADLGPAIRHCWSTLWDDVALAYWCDRVHADVPAMAVVLQPLIHARAAGVAFSQNPVRPEPDGIVIHAVRGLGEPLVSGRARPDVYIVRRGSADELSLRLATVAEQRSGLFVDAAGRTVERACSPGECGAPSLNEAEAIGVARVLTDIERAERRPMDIEWVLDAERVWIVQSRPITTLAKPAALTDAGCVWSRANFKETFPDVPSPLAISLLREHLEHNIVRHYREAGCSVPPRVSAFRVFRGRPYINVTLFESFISQLGGNPTLVTDHMGGQTLGPPATDRLPWTRRLVGGVKIFRTIWRAQTQAPPWFASLAARERDMQRDDPDEADAWRIVERIDEDGRAERDQPDLTFALVAGVSLGLYMLEATLKRRSGGWRDLLNQAVQGQGTIISANQIRRLQILARQAAEDGTVQHEMLREPWDPIQTLSRVAGTPFGRAFAEFLDEYGHRAVGESDVMTPRFRETPGSYLGMIRELLRTPDAARAETPSADTAGTGIRVVFGWRWHEWLWFQWWHRFLCRYLALREANRHALMHSVAALRRALLVIGGSAVEAGVLNAPDDIFFLTKEELAEFRAAPRADWRSRVARRRQEREAVLQLTAPDTLLPGQPGDSLFSADGDALAGTAISSGCAEGPIRIVRSATDIAQVQSGDIVVLPVIDPGHAPLMSVAGGLVVELGGSLSHGAIIAREYGIPALVNVLDASQRLSDGEWVRLDTAGGCVKRLPRPAAAQRA